MINNPVQSQMRSGFHQFEPIVSRFVSIQSEDKGCCAKITGAVSHVLAKIRDLFIKIICCGCKKTTTSGELQTSNIQADNAPIPPPQATTNLTQRPSQVLNRIATRAHRPSAPSLQRTATQEQLLPQVSNSTTTQTSTIPDSTPQETTPHQGQPLPQVPEGVNVHDSPTIDPTPQRTTTVEQTPSQVPGSATTQTINDSIPTTQTAVVRAEPFSLEQIEKINASAEDLVRSAAFRERFYANEQERERVLSILTLTDPERVRSERDYQEIKGVVEQLQTYSLPFYRASPQLLSVLATEEKESAVAIFRHLMDNVFLLLGNPSSPVVDLFPEPERPRRPERPAGAWDEATESDLRSQALRVAERLAASEHFKNECYLNTQYRAEIVRDLNLDHRPDYSPRFGYMAFRYVGVLSRHQIGREAGEFINTLRQATFEGDKEEQTYEIVEYIFEKAFKGIRRRDGDLTAWPRAWTEEEARQLWQHMVPRMEQLAQDSRCIEYYNAEGPNSPVRLFNLGNEENFSPDFERISRSMLCEGSTRIHKRLRKALLNPQQQQQALEIYRGIAYNVSKMIERNRRDR